MARVRTAVWQPPTDRAAGRDPDVRRSLRLLREHSDRLARAWSGLVFLALLCLFTGLPVSTGLATVAVLVVSRRMVTQWLRVGRYRAVVDELLATELARSIEAEHLGGQLLKIDGNTLRFPVLMPTVRLADHVWLVGPNAAGQAVVFGDAVVYPNFGQTVAEPAQRLSGQRPARGEPRVGARSSARSAARGFARRWVFTALMVISIGTELAPQPQVLTWLYVIAALTILVLAGRQWLRIAPCLRAPSLLRAPLVEYPAKLGPDQSVVVTLPDGSELAGKVVWSVQLLANVRASGLLWVAGIPAPDMTLGVGVPDYPIAGVVRFTK